MPKQKRSKKTGKELDVNQIVEFHDPYPVSRDSEYGQYQFVFSKQLQQVINRLDGNKLSLIGALKRIQAVTKGRIEVIPEHRVIILVIRPSDNCYYSFRLIKYKQN